MFHSSEQSDSPRVLYVLHFLYVSIFLFFLFLLATADYVEPEHDLELTFGQHANAINHTVIAYEEEVTDDDSDTTTEKTIDSLWSIHGFLSDTKYQFTVEQEEEEEEGLVKEEKGRFIHLTVHHTNMNTAQDSVRSLAPSLKLPLTIKT